MMTHSNCPLLKYSQRHRTIPICHPYCETTDIPLGNFLYKKENNNKPEVDPASKLKHVSWINLLKG